MILMVIAVECFVSGAKPILADIVREGLSRYLQVEVCIVGRNG